MDRGIRLFHPGNYQGEYSAKERKRLIKLVKKEGRNWEKIANILGRHATACRDIYDREMNYKKYKKRGNWTVEEEEEFVRLVLKHNAKAKSKGAISEDELADIPEKDIYFSIIAKKLNRPPHNLMTKWYCNLHGKIRGHYGRKWTERMNRNLVNALYELAPEDESDIHFNELLPNCAGQLVRTKWRALRLTVPSDKRYNLENAIDYLHSVYKAKVISESDSDESDSDESDSDESGSDSNANKSDSEGSNSENENQSRRS